jgi:hypothetical protein
MVDDWNPDTGGRSLAEILREAGVERANRANRRSWDDPEQTAIRQRRAEAAADRSNSSGYGRRKSDFAESLERAAATDAPPMDRRQSRRATPPEPAPSRRATAFEPSTAAIPGLRPDRKPGVPHPSGPIPDTPLRGPDSPLRKRRPAEREPLGREPAAREPAAREPAARERPARERPGREAAGRERLTPRAGSRKAAPPESHPSTGPIPVVRPDDIDDTDLDTSPRESALAWLRFAGELIIALAAGVGVYFAATLLWEQLPYVAVVLVPLAVTGLVAGVSVWRHRQGREAPGPRLLALLVLAGTLLTIAPAAELLTTRT